MLCSTAAALTSAHPGLLPNHPPFPLKGQRAGTTPRARHWSPSSAPAHKAAALTLGSAGWFPPQKVQGRDGQKVGVLSQCLASPHLILPLTEGSTHTASPVLLSTCFFLHFSSFYCPFSFSSWNIFIFVGLYCIIPYHLFAAEKLCSSTFGCSLNRSYPIALQFIIVLFSETFPDVQHPFWNYRNQHYIWYSKRWR